jgi:hypothetical protein
MDNSNAHDIRIQDMVLLKDYLFCYFINNSNAHNMGMQDMVMLKDYLFSLFYR